MAIRKLLDFVSHNANSPNKKCNESSQNRNENKKGQRIRTPVRNEEKKSYGI